MRKITEGKTKIVWGINDRLVRVESKDDITAGDGTLRDEIRGKAELANETACNCFALLSEENIPTHWLEKCDERSFMAYHCLMVPLECVARRIATGSYLKRSPETFEGTVFERIVFEFFEKDDANHDPLVIFDIEGGTLGRYQPKLPLEQGFISTQPLAESRFRDLSPRDLDRMAAITRWVFRTLERAWQEQDVQLVDLKIEFGFTPNGELVVADIIDNDSWRIWPGGDKTQMKDKQAYRDLDERTPEELGRIKDNYRWVAEATQRFLL